MRGMNDLITLMIISWGKTVELSNRLRNGGLQTVMSRMYNTMSRLSLGHLMKVIRELPMTHRPHLVTPHLHPQTFRLCRQAQTQLQPSRSGSELIVMNEAAD